MTKITYYVTRCPKANNHHLHHVLFDTFQTAEGSLCVTNDKIFVIENYLISNHYIQYIIYTL